ncbi:hypothetical protein D9611_001154 [Ephemerocybe angulata]|uniref:TEA domain-containing protein n=1 Tax=Ephemerocybe angulata TaxID=980116 RepID=A0A8H5CI80_9AGAR|nr:hypothetical protein D9611_001154 [Tulosesus angulatus]
MSSVPPASFTVDTTPVSDLGNGRRGRNVKGSMAKTGRRTFKTSGKERNAVWPDSLEIVLLQALAKYAPPPSRTMRGSEPFKRFPKRNKTISQYIFNVTGKFRSHKQVGSRLQQLRGTCKDPQVLQYLNDRTRFSGSDRSRTSSPSLSSRAQSEESVQAPAQMSALSPQESGVVLTRLPLAPSPIPRTISLDFTVVDDDWSHRSRSSPHLIVNLDDIDYTMHEAFTTSQSHLPLAPLITVSSFDLNDASLYRTTFTTYCNDELVNSHTCDVPSEYNSPVVTHLAPDFWHEIVGTLSHDPDSQSVAYPCRADLQPSVLVSMPPASPLSGPSSPASYDSDVSVYGSYSDIMSPVEHFDYSELAESSSSSFPMCPPNPSFALQIPQAATECVEPYSLSEVWSHPEAHQAPQLHLPIPYLRHYRL